MKTGYPRKFKRQFIAAYLKSFNISKACKEMNIPRQVFYDWMNSKNEWFKQEFEAVKEEAVDYQLDEAEDKHRILRQGIPKFEEKEVGGKTMLVQTGWEVWPDRTAIEFYLTKKGKKRGYGDALELTGKDGKDLFSTMTDEELEKKLERLTKITKNQ